MTSLIGTIILLKLTKIYSNLSNLTKTPAPNPRFNLLRIAWPLPLVLTPSLCWHLRHHFAGVVAVVAVIALVLLPALHPRVASIVQASLPAFCWHRCPHRTHVAPTIVWASLLAFHWCQHPHHAGIYVNPHVRTISLRIMNLPI